MAPKFTATHHRIIADMFWIRAQELKPTAEPVPQQQVQMAEWGVMQARFRNMFAGDNFRFKPIKFDIACGLDPVVKIPEEG